MKVRITKGGNKSWYSEFIGETFEVIATSEYNMDYKVVGASKAKLLKSDRDGTLNYYIVKEDCEVLGKPCEVVNDKPKFSIGDTVKVLDASGFQDKYQGTKEAVVKNADNLNSIELTMKDGVSQWIGHWHLEAMEKPQFSIGNKVLITQPDHWLNGKTGTIIATRSSIMYSWCVEVNGGDRYVFEEKYMELVLEEQCTPTDKQWFTKEEALKLAIDGAKVVTEHSGHQDTYVFFDGKDFKYYNGINGEFYNIGYFSGRWKLWTPTSPKFTNGTFVVDECGDYMRVIDSEFVDGRYKYYLASGKDCTKEFCHKSWESELTLA